MKRKTKPWQEKVDEFSLKYLEVYRAARRLISKVPPRALRDPRTGADRERKRGSAPAEEYFVGRHGAFSSRL